MSHTFNATSQDQPTQTSYFLSSAPPGSECRASHMCGIPSLSFSILSLDPQSSPDVAAAVPPLDLCLLTVPFSPRELYMGTTSEGRFRKGLSQLLLRLERDGMRTPLCVVSLSKDNRFQGQGLRNKRASRAEAFVAVEGSCQKHRSHLSPANHTRVLCVPGTWGTE